jgi:hypothetical protein
MSRGMHDEAASVVVLVAIMMVVFVSVLALTIDLGLLRDERSHAQNGADNAAMSAAYAFCQTVTSLGKTHGDAVVAGLAEGNRIAVANGFPVAQATVTAPAAGSGLWTVTIDTSIDAYFAPAVTGQEELETAVTAHALCTPNATASSGMPAVWAGGDCADKTLLLNGSGTVIDGAVHSNDRIEVSGSNIKVNGNGSYVTTIKDNIAAKITWNPSMNNPVKLTARLPDPTGFAYTYASFRTGGDYFTAGANRNHIFAWPPPAAQVVGGRLKPGIYTSTGLIDLSSYVGGDNVTFISQGGAQPSIKFPRSNVTYTPFLDGFIAISYGTTDCGGFAIDISGSNVKLDGKLYAPNGGIKWSGSGNNPGDASTGPMIGKHVTLSGSKDQLRGSVASPAFDPKVTLVR